MPDELRIRPATVADFELATRWLAAAELPTDDLTPGHLRDFLLAERAASPVAMIGLEQFARQPGIGLLRSLVVDPSCRGAGLGRRLVTALEATASQRDVRELWLLTIDADLFFARLGYAAMARTEAPAAIQSTPEFSSLCPGDAVLMRKLLTLRQPI